MKHWIKLYERSCHPVRIAYNPLGSGAGVVQFMQGTTAFGGTDSPVDSEENTPDERVCTGGRVINLPMVGGAIASATTCQESTTWCWTPRRSPRSSTRRSPSGTIRRSGS